MEDILKFLNQNGISIDECNEDWVEKVKNFEAVEKTLTPQQVKDKIEHLIKIFDDYHEIEEVEPEPEPEPDDDESINLQHNSEKSQKKFDARKKRGSAFDVADIFS